MVFKIITGWGIKDEPILTLHPPFNLARGMVIDILQLWLPWYTKGIA